ncbi:MAG: hypothetical protein OEQ13_09180 [Acidobacteriota bacterium]|nr:hypothetical protein [Acidobacteriota bacterium]
MDDSRHQLRQSVAAAVASAAILVGFVMVFGPPVLERVRLSGHAPGRGAETRAPDEAPGLDDLDPIDRVTAAVRATDGGSVTGPGGLSRLEVPPGALDKDVSVELVRYAVHAPADPTGFAVDLRPDGLRFRDPARLELRVPPGLDPAAVEIAVFDPETGSWQPELDQEFDAEQDVLRARIHHFSLRRVRIRPGIEFPYDPSRARGTFYMEADAGNTFERYLEGRWRAVEHRTTEYRELMRLDRSGRHALIVSGRLRAITGARPRPEVFRDHKRTVAMPAGAPEARTGWVRITRLDQEGRETPHRVVARVNDFGPGPAARRTGVVVDMTRSTMEALGLTWGGDFGLARDGGNLAWIRHRPGETSPPLRYVPLRVESYDPQPARSFSCRLP